MMSGIFLLLGTNQGKRLRNLEVAFKLLMSKDILVQKKSRVYKSAPWGILNQPSFLNQALQIETKLSAEELLNTVKNIELEMGRTITIKWGERIIDIDILYYHDSILENENLVVPHPQIPFRRFTLVPLVELQPNFIHPVLKKSQADLLLNCTDPLEVMVYNGEQ